MDLLDCPSVFGKLECLDACVHDELLKPRGAFDYAIARDIQVLPVRSHPNKVSLHRPEGQARLLHDLASIELQAMELGFRTLCEYPDAPAFFRQELAEITRGEGRHLKLCLEALESMGFSWGHWPVHTALWGSVDKTDSLLDRILIVHRYLEGSGLDAGDSILRRLATVDSKHVRSVLEVIFKEEVGHVEFGSRWYRQICRDEKLEPGDDFGSRMRQLHFRLPRRMEPFCRPLRYEAGFLDSELAVLEGLREIRYSGGASQS